MENIETRNIIATLIRSETKKSGKSLSELAELYGNTRQNFSRIIRSEALIKPEMINFILKNTSDVEFDFDPKRAEEARKIFAEIFDAYFYMDKMKVQKLSLLLKTEYYYSYALPYYLLGKTYEALLFKDHDRLRCCIEQMNEMKECIRNDLNDHFEYISGCELLMMYRSKQAYDRIVNKNFKDLRLTALKAELLTSLCCDLRKPLDGMTHYHYAVRLFQRENCFYRAIAIENIKGIFYTQLNDFDQAIVTWREMEQEALRYDQPHITNTAEVNISFAYFEKGDYRNAVKYPPVQNDGYYWNIQIAALFFSNYYLGNDAECRNIKKLLKQCNGDPKAHQYLEQLMDCYLEGKSADEKAEVLNDILRLLLRDENKLNLTWVLKLLAQEYKNAKDYENLVKTQERLLELFDFHL